MVSNTIREECCGTTCDKNELATKVKLLEIQNAELQKEVDEYNRLRANKEAFAKQVFIAGRESVYAYPNCTEKAWLSYKVTEL